jgi:4-carboxymuconolactone decarboxylase
MSGARMRRNSGRIDPLTDEELNDEIVALLPRLVVAGQATPGRSNIMRTLVRHRSLFARWTPFLDALLNGELPPRDRELLVLRTAWHCRSDYVWGQHVVVGRKIGLTDEEIHRTRAGPDAPGWSLTDSLLIRVADELHATVRVSEPTWQALAAQYNERQLIEILTVLGHYRLIAGVVNSLHTPLDDGLPPLDS